jgi:hypothetical protein
MNIHHYDATTKIFKRTTTAISGHGVPANATTVAVPTVAAGQEAVFNESTSTWSTRAISVGTPSSTTPLTDFANMTLDEKLVYYGLGDLVGTLTSSATIANQATVDAQMALLQSTISNLQNDVTSMGTTNATVTHNQQLIQELVDDFNRLNSTLILE